jgi:hypothetical protein
VSYDIYFLNRHEGQTWDEALEALEGDAEEVELSPEMIYAWDRILPQARALLGEVDVFEDGESLELTHHPTGMQFSIFAGEAGITVPYWHSGDDAGRVIAMAYALAAVVERETGLEGYDPQVERPVSELAQADAEGILSQIAEDIRARYSTGPTGTS